MMSSVGDLLSGVEVRYNLTPGPNISDHCGTKGLMQKY